MVAHDVVEGDFRGGQESEDGVQVRFRPRIDHVAKLDQEIRMAFSDRLGAFLQERKGTPVVSRARVVLVRVLDIRNRGERECGSGRRRIRGRTHGEPRKGDPEGDPPRGRDRVTVSFGAFHSWQISLRGTGIQTRVFG